MRVPISQAMGSCMMNIDVHHSYGVTQRLRPLGYHQMAQMIHYQPMQAQKDDDTSLFNHYRTMIELRKDNPALMYGNGFIEWDGSTGSLQGYYRSYSYEDFSQNILVIHNISSTAKTVEVDYDKILYGSLELGAFETVILEVEAN